MMDQMPQTSKATDVQESWPAIKSVHAAAEFGGRSEALSNVFERLGDAYYAWWCKQACLENGSEARNSLLLQDLLDRTIPFMERESSIPVSFPYLDQKRFESLDRAMTNLGYELDSSNVRYELKHTSNNLDSSLPTPLKTYSAWAKPYADFVVPEKDLIGPHSDRGADDNYMALFALNFRGESTEKIDAEEAYNGRQDSEAVRQYLNAYKKLFESPSAEALFEATKKPKAGAGYNVCQLQLMEQGIPRQFETLIQVAFCIQSAAKCPATWQAMHQTDQNMMAALLDLYISDNHLG